MLLAVGSVGGLPWSMVTLSTGGTALRKSISVAILVGSAFAVSACAQSKCADFSAKIVEFENILAEQSATLSTLKAQDEELQRIKCEEARADAAAAGDTSDELLLDEDPRFWVGIYCESEPTYFASTVDAFDAVAETNRAMAKFIDASPECASVEQLRFAERTLSP